MRQRQFLCIRPRSSTEDSGSFHLFQPAEWFGDVFAVVGDVLDEFSWGSSTAAAYDDAFGSVGESVGGLLGDDDRSANQGEGLVNLEFAFIEASPDGGISTGPAGVWSGDDGKDFFCTVTVQVYPVIDITGVCTFFFRQFIVCDNGLFQFGTGVGLCVLFWYRGRNPCFRIIGCNVSFASQFQCGQSVFLIKPDVVLAQGPFFPCSSSFVWGILYCCWGAVQFSQNFAVRFCLGRGEGDGYDVCFSIGVV